ncbi:hypothetical protein KGF57_000449 [Candida theae]|uniref:Uncharacterized protein n=1 Tax=Candida theae TaxID=1198502 RepID=A0AAD5BJG0_9ASCO|nr:uncharacterized protein KGF57_000449 [Candida theae]KAI5967234.1 hypothetical protein KGF57_000449 [Candida theae]
MSHGYAQLFFKLKLEEDVMFNYLSCGHTISPQWVSSKPYTTLRSLKESEVTNEEDHAQENQGYIDEEERGYSMRLLQADQESYQEHLSQLNGLKIKIQQDQTKAYTRSVKRYRKNERHWIRLYHDKKKQEDMEQARQMEKERKHLEQKRQLKQTVKYFRKKVSRKIMWSKMQVRGILATRRKEFSKDKKMESQQTVLERQSTPILLQKEVDPFTNRTDPHQEYVSTWESLHRILNLEKLTSSLICRFKKPAIISTHSSPNHHPFTKGSISKLGGVLLQINYQRRLHIRWERTKCHLRFQIKLIYNVAQLLAFEYRLCKVYLVRKCPVLQDWTSRLWFAVTKFKMRINRGILSSLNETLEMHEYEDTDPTHLTTPNTDHFMQIHQAFLNFEMYKLYLLCQCRIQFTLLTI